MHLQADGCFRVARANPIIVLIAAFMDCIGREGVRLNGNVDILVT